MTSQHQRGPTFLTAVLQRGKVRIWIYEFLEPKVLYDQGKLNCVWVPVCRWSINQTFWEELTGLHCATAQGNAQGDESTLEGQQGTLLKHPWCFLNTQFNTDVCSCFLNCSSFDSHCWIWWSTGGVDCTACKGAEAVTIMAARCPCHKV